MEKMPLLLLLFMLPLFSRVACESFQEVTNKTLIDMQYVFQNVLIGMIVDAHTKDDLQLSVDIEACMDKIKVTEEKCQYCTSEKCKTAPSSDNRKRSTDPQRESNGDVTEKRLESFEIENEDLPCETIACYRKCPMCYDVLSTETDILVRTVCGPDILIRNRTLEKQKRTAQSFYKVLGIKAILTKFEYDVDSFEMVDNTPQFLSTRVTAEMPQGVASTYVSDVPYIIIDQSKTANLLAKEALQRWQILTEDK